MLELVGPGLALILLGAAPAATIMVAQGRKLPIQRVLLEGVGLVLGGVVGMAPGVLLWIGRGAAGATGAVAARWPGWVLLLITFGGLVAGAVLGLVLVARLSRRPLVRRALTAGVGGLVLGCSIAFAAIALTQGTPFELAVLGALPISLACATLAPYLRTA